MQPHEPFDDLDFDPGTLLDHRYQIVALLGSGGMGRVYKAFHVLLDTPVALKKMTVPEDATPEQRQHALRRFYREARLLTMLRHPNIPRVLDYFTQDGSCYLVMDYLEGITLAERLGVGLDSAEREPLPLDEALNYAIQLCDVLTYLHSQQPPVVFGDLKPANVILTSDGRAVMVDFGIARPSKTRSDTPPWQLGLGGVGPATPSSNTQPLGTAGYAAPEQYEQNWQADPRSDTFALGVLLHEMVTGHTPPPFPFGFQPARALNPAVPARLEEIIERALAFDPNERFQTAAQMRQALQLVIQERSAHTAQTGEIVISPQAQAAPTKIPPGGTRSGISRWHLRQTLLACAGAASVMAVIAVGLLLFGLTSGNPNLAQNSLNHPLSVAPTPTNTSTPTPTNTPTLPPHSQPGMMPASTPVATSPPTDTPTVEPKGSPPPSPTPTETPTTPPNPSPTAPGPPGVTPTPTSTPTPKPTHTPTPEPTHPPTPTPGPANTATPTPKPTHTPTPGPANTATPTPRLIHSPTPEPTYPPKPKATHTPTPRPHPPKSTPITEPYQSTTPPTATPPAPTDTPGTTPSATPSSSSRHPDPSNPKHLHPGSHHKHHKQGN